jgi:protein-S-isoprenylcysteine O-methyltransferase Ste14
LAPLHVIYGLWVAWAFSWFVAAAWSGRTVARPSFFTVLPDRFVTVLGAFLLFSSRPDAPLHATPLWHIDDALARVLVAVTASGFAFCWWARIYPGRLWSGNVTRKEGHTIVDTGPYRFVRHPIYTGIIIASFVTAIAIGTPGSLAGAAIMSLGWYLKARVEERFLREGLGAQAYDAYARKTAMLIPFVRL